jgi:3D (Asp-Asp-Asp) domain-containing protein
MYYSKRTFYFLSAVLLFLLSACGGPEIRSMEVTATAFNSVKAQTDKHSNITAWGDTLKPGMMVIAISRDLLDSGLIYGKEVRIEGLEGTFVVLDKMHRRHTKKIDIYMGKDVAKAREWGSQKVTISWTPRDST